MPTLTEVRTLAVQLPVKPRLRLAGELLDTSDDSHLAWTDDDILAEATERDEELESGKVKALTLAEFTAVTAARRQALASERKA